MQSRPLWRHCNDMGQYLKQYYVFHYMYSWNSTLCIWTFQEIILPKASFGFRALSLPAYVCLSVHLCVNHLFVRDNWGPVQAWITKFGPKVWKTFPMISDVLWGIDLELQGQIKLKTIFKLTPFWACPYHNSSPVQARITKFGPEWHNSAVKTPVV